MPFFLILILATFSAFGIEDCPEEKTNLDKIGARVVELSCPSTFESEEYKFCSKEIRNAGGIFTVKCDQPKFKDCCYKKISGSTRSDFARIDCPESPKSPSRTVSQPSSHVQAPIVFTHRAANLEECANQLIKEDMESKGNKVYSVHSAFSGEGGHYVQDWSWSKFERGDVGNLEMYFEGRHGRTLKMFGGEARIFAQQSSDKKSVQCAVNPDPTFLKKGIWYSPNKRPWHSLKPGFSY